MNQCVPSWDIENINPPPPRIAHSNSIPASLDYEVAELTWENGQLAMHGLGTPRVVNKAAATTSSTWEKRSSGGTLESLVDQATCLPHTKSATGANLDELVPWFNHHRAIINPAASGGGATMTMDALVPCNNLDQSTHVQEYAPGTCTCVGGCSTGVGSCNPAAMDGGAGGGRVARVGISERKTNMSLSVCESATCGGEDSHQVTLDTCDLGGATFTSTSPDNTSSGKEYTGDDHDSVCHSRSQRKRGAEEGKKKGIIGKSTVSTKRGRAAAIHNQSERKRRDKINQRMKTLQKMVPNSSKTDKASMLDEVIDYLKQLQAQVHMMSRMSMPSMMLPLAMQQQQIQMSMMGMQMGMGMGMDMNSTTRAAMPVPPVMSPASPFMPWENPNYLSSRAIPDPMNAFLACQSHPMSNNVDAYARLAAMYQHIQQNPGSGPTN